MRGTFLFLFGIVACSSTVSPSGDAGSDSMSVTVTDAADEQDSGPSVDCEPDTKMGNPMGATFKSGTRNVLVRTPPGYDPTVFSPLIVVYAPAVATGPQTETFTGLTPKAKARGYVIAYPDHISPASTADFTAAA